MTVAEGASLGFSFASKNAVPLLTLASGSSMPSSLDVSSTIRQMSGGYGPDELWGYSVINTKNMRITYHLPREMEDYITNVVEFYVKQMIPSTVILDIKWEYV